MPPLQRLLGFLPKLLRPGGRYGEAHRNSARKELVSKLVGYNLLIIDEFGMKSMPQNAADDLLESFIEGIKQHHNYCYQSSP